MKKKVFLLDSGQVNLDTSSCERQESPQQYLLPKITITPKNIRNLKNASLKSNILSAKRIATVTSSKIINAYGAEESIQKRKLFSSVSERRIIDVINRPGQNEEATYKDSYGDTKTGERRQSQRRLTSTSLSVAHLQLENKFVPKIRK